MTENIVTLAKTDESATALIRHERSTSKVRYAAYIVEHDVTLETVPAHVQGLANLAGSIRKWETPAERKAFCTKIRNGLKHHLAPEVDDTEDDTKDEDDPMAAVLAAAKTAIKKGLSKDAIAKAIKGL